MKIAMMFNSPYLGGAERSFIVQSTFVERAQMDFFIPSFGESYGDIHQLLNHHGVRDQQIHYYSYPQSLFSVSRSGFKWLKLFFALFAFLKLLKEMSKLEIDDYEVVWSNGNKVGLVSFIYCWLSGFKGTLLWHFRDYPSLKFPFRYIWKLFRLPKCFRLELIANSFSVKESLDQVASQTQKYVVYNPSGLVVDPSQKEDQENSFVLAYVGMLAPWKGVHQLITFCSLYEEELKELGVKEIRIYGGQIYQTKGDHESYDQQLMNLHQKLNTSLIKFCGLAKPEDIYSEVDLIFHTSVSPEPFGRVLIEAMQANVSVLSTGLGGACELIGENEERGFKILPYNYSGWMDIVFNALVEDEGKERRKRANEFALSFDRTIQRQLDLVFKN